MQDAFDQGVDRLHLLAEQVPSRQDVIHRDWVNRNVLVTDANITSVFDWGCSMYGDHLYDVAWLTLCAPWTSGFDRQATRRVTREHYVAEGIDPDDFDRRVECYELHIALGALTYQAFLGDRGTTQWLARQIVDPAERDRTDRLRDRCGLCKAGQPASPGPSAMTPRSHPRLDRWRVGIGRPLGPPWRAPLRSVPAITELDQPVRVFLCHRSSPFRRHRHAIGRPVSLIDRRSRDGSVRLASPHRRNGLAPECHCRSVRVHDRGRSRPSLPPGRSRSA